MKATPPKGVMAPSTRDSRDRQQVQAPGEDQDARRPTASRPNWRIPAETCRSWAAWPQSAFPARAGNGTAPRSYRCPGGRRPGGLSIRARRTRPVPTASARKTAAIALQFIESPRFSASWHTRCSSRRAEFPGPRSGPDTRGLSACSQESPRSMLKHMATMMRPWSS